MIVEEGGSKYVSFTLPRINAGARVAVMRLDEYTQIVGEAQQQPDFDAAAATLRRLFWSQADIRYFPK